MAQMNPSMTQKQTDIRNGLVVAKDGAGGRLDRECGTSDCKLLHTKWIDNKVLYSTGNYVQDPVVNHKGKEHENECVCVCVCVHAHTYICICITELLCCAPKPNTT